MYILTYVIYYLLCVYYGIPVYTSAGGGANITYTYLVFTYSTRVFWEEREGNRKSFLRYFWKTRFRKVLIISRLKYDRVIVVDKNYRHFGVLTPMMAPANPTAVFSVWKLEKKPFVCYVYNFARNRFRDIAQKRPRSAHEWREFLQCLVMYARGKRRRKKMQCLTTDIENFAKIFLPHDCSYTNFALDK